MKSKSFSMMKGLLSLLVMGVLLILGGSAWAADSAESTTTEEKAAATPAALQGFMNYADFTWVNGNTREKDFPLDGKIFSPEFLFDTNYVYDFAKPNDHMISGSTAFNMSNQVEVEHVGIGGDFHVDNVRGRIMTEFGMYANEIPRNDETPARGSWNIQQGTQYITEAYGGYHFDIPGTDGLNVDVGQFPSYVGLGSFYNSENWSYSLSYVSSDTPWFFTGSRIQFFPNDTLKIEGWIINGWQTYGAFDEGLGGTGMNYGAEVRWAPNPGLVVISNNYVGPDNPNSPNCIKYHTDDSVLVKYFDDPKSNGISKMAFSLTADAGFQQGPLYEGAGTVIGANENGLGPSGTGYVVGPSGYVTVGAGGQFAESFLGAMFYDRTWFAHDTIAFTFGGGVMSNPGGYLALLPPIDGDSAATYSADSNATKAFAEYPGEQWVAWDYDFGIQIMPTQYLTIGLEYTHRFSSLNYFVGPGGVTSSDGWTSGAGTGSAQTNTGAYTPNLVQFEDLIIGSLMVHI